MGEEVSYNIVIMLYLKQILVQNSLYKFNTNPNRKETKRDSFILKNKINKTHNVCRSFSKF